MICYTQELKNVWSQACMEWLLNLPDASFKERFNKL